MAQFPKFSVGFTALSKATQRHLHKHGLSDLGVLDSDVEVSDVAQEPQDAKLLIELLPHAQRAPRVQGAEFARRVLDVFARRDQLKREEQRERERAGPSQRQRAAQVLREWHERRLPSRITWDSKLEGAPKSIRGREAEVVNRSGGLHPGPDRSARRSTSDTRTPVARMCASVRAGTLRNYARAIGSLACGRQKEGMACRTGHKMCWRTWNRWPGNFAPSAALRHAPAALACCEEVA